jgi:glycine/D-amino acid oxidase-like deaminating enzyme
VAHRTADVVIIGGSVVGASIAWHLRQQGVPRVVVIERDRQYQRASAFLAMGGIRQQFCTAVTVKMVQHSVGFWSTFDERMGTPDARPRAWFRQRGYLFLGTSQNAAALTHRYERQRDAGAEVSWLTREDIRKLVPDAWLDDVDFGVFGPQDGYANPREVLSGMHRAARDAGADFIEGTPVALQRHGRRITTVALANGDTIDAGTVVNAAGAWGGAIARMAALDVPITPLRQMLFRATLPHRWPSRFPMVIDPSGVHWRHDDPVIDGDPDRIVVACTTWDDEPGERFDPDESRWTRDFLPPLVRRMPGFRHLTDVHGWAGLYEMTPDHNPALGEHPEGPGLIFACGFSGHGLMMSPATGLLVSEMITRGRSETFDVGLFAPDRFARGALVHDEATI